MTIKDKLTAVWRVISSPRPPSEIPADESDTVKRSGAPRHVAEYLYEDGEITEIDGVGYQPDNDPTTWNKTDELTDGTRIGQLGALWYVLDDDNNSISLGYHNINTRGDETGYVGQIGGHREIFDPESDENDDSKLSDGN